MKPGISLCVLAKNEEQYIHYPIMSVKDFVNEIVVIDDRSSDKTVLVAQGLGARIVKNQISPKQHGFSKVYNWAISNLEYEWVLILDADEFLTDAHLLQTLTQYPGKEAWNLPRRKWENFQQSRKGLSLWVNAIRILFAINFIMLIVVRI
jgi:glycosyltransferase involved in cell wall biosynthesis